MTASEQAGVPIEQVAVFVRGVGSGVVATVAASGAPEAALVGLTMTDAGELIFDSYDDARKITNLHRDERVAVVISQGDISVQIEGTATILDGEPRLRYAAAYLDQFPGSRVLADGLSVVRVTPRWFRWYDAGPATARVIEWSA